MLTKTLPRGAGDFGSVVNRRNTLCITPKAEIKPTLPQAANEDQRAAQTNLQGIGLSAEKKAAESQILAKTRKPSAAPEKRYWFPPLRREQR
jgi:hypothetical protein